MKLNQKRNGRNLKKGRLLVALLWLVLGTMLVLKVTGPALNLFIARDNSSYTQQYSQSWESKDQAYLEYATYSSELANSSDSVISWFFTQNTLVQLVVYLIALAPSAILVFAIINDVSEAFEKRASKKTSSKKMKECRA